MFVFVYVCVFFISLTLRKEFGGTDPFLSTPAAPAASLDLTGFTPVGIQPTRSASNGADEFSDFQSSGVSNSGNSASGTRAGRGGATNGASSEVNTKWRDVSSLVDLGGLTSNTDNKVSEGTGRGGRGGDGSVALCGAMLFFGECRGFDSVSGRSRITGYEVFSFILRSCFRQLYTYLRSCAFVRISFGLRRSML